MKTRQKVSLTFLSLSCVCMLFNGCAKRSDDGKILKSNTITTASCFGSADFSSEDYNKLRRDFSNETKIEVIDSSSKADDKWKSEIRLSFEKGKQPDVMYFFTKTDVSDIIQKNQVVSIDEIRAVYPDYAMNISPESLYDLRESNDKTYAVPVMRFWEGLFCNEKLFEKYNVKPITDWNSLLEAIDIFNANGITPIASSFSDIPNYLLEHTIGAASGVKGHAANPKSIKELPESWTEGLNLLKELYDRKAFSKDCCDTQHQLAINLYNTQQAAMIIEGSWLQLNSDVEKVTRIAAMPSSKTLPIEQKVSISGVSCGWYITRQAWEDEAKRDNCIKYIKYMTSDKAISMLCRGGLPTTKNKIELTVDVRPKITSDAFQMLKNTKTDMPIDSRLSKGAWEYLIQKTPAIVKGEAKPSDVLKKVVEFNASKS
ncbi:MAG: extracellular solute-binding protein [Oscillospiraceae bacterium]